MKTVDAYQPGADIRGKRVGGYFTEPQKPQTDEKKQGKDYNAADKTRLFGKYREDKVGALFGKKTIMALGAL